MAADTGQDLERISRDINRDYWMSAREARDYGVIDEVITNRELVDPMAAVAAS